MASTPSKLPEGTDKIIAGAAGDADGAGGGESGSAATPGSVAEKLRSQAADLGSQATSKVVELRGQATDQIFAFAAQGKDRATEALDGAAKLIGDAAGQVEEKLGGSAGAYARQAAETVSGFATTLRSKEIEDLIVDTRGFVKRSPALALGVAAAAGFLVARVIKAGSTTLETTARSIDPEAAAGGGTTKS